jgi:sugar lactone lactonase YvrE
MSNNEQNNNYKLVLFYFQERRKMLFYLASNPKPFHPSCDWTRDGVTVLSQLKNPTGLFIVEDDDDVSIYVADSGNHRVVKWTPNDSMNSPVIISINGTNQLSYPRDILVSKKDGSIFICDKGNERIVRWNKEATQGQTLLTNVECESLIMDKSGSLIAPQLNKDRVTKWQGIDETHSSEKTIAGGHGKGSDLNQLNHPRDIFLDEQDQSIYVSDSDNHRIIKWTQGSKEGIIVAGGNGRGNKHDQLAHPRGIALHSNGDLYIADTSNNRIVKWKQGAETGTIIVDGHLFGRGQHSPQPFGLVFDQHYRNLYVTDWANSRLVRFSIDGMGNCGKRIFSLSN